MLLLVRPINADDRMILVATLLLAGFVLFGVSWPLVRRKIPRNHFYGIRIREAFASADRWYEVNAIGGRYLARAACAIFATGLLGLVVPSGAFVSYIIVAAGVVLASLLISIILTLRWVKATRVSLPGDAAHR
jgi:hypothetical protein